MSTKKPLYFISEFGLGVMGDRPQYSEYGFETWGDTREELLKNATITEVDQDGGELDTTGIEEAGGDLERVIEDCIDAEMAEQDREREFARQLVAALKEFLKCVEHGDLVIRPDQDPNRTKGAHARCAGYAVERAKEVLSKVKGK